MDASVRIVASVMQSMIMFGNVQLVGAAVSDRELTRQLATAIGALLNEALHLAGG